MTAIAVRDRLLTAHTPVFEAALACADHVVTAWDGPTTVDRGAVAAPYERRLRATGVLELLLGSFVDAVATAGESPAAAPVPSAPYAVVTAEGVVLRLSVDDGRFVGRLRAFDRDPYRRGPPLPEALSVERRGASKSDG